MKTRPQINDTLEIEPSKAEKFRRQLIEQLKTLAEADGKSITVNYYPIPAKRPEMIRRN